MTKPITPAEISAKKTQIIPPTVIKIWNEAIASKFSGNSAIVKQEEIVESILAQDIVHDSIKVTRSKIFELGWLDIGEMYMAAGWSVTYDRPGYNETYSATFTFRKSRVSC